MALNKTYKYFLIIVLSVGVFFGLGYYLSNLKSKSLDKLEVILTAKIYKDDVFQFFYWANSDRKFKTSKSVKSEVRGQKGYQEVIFILPNIEDLSKLRLDIGSNSKQDIVIIKEIKFNKGNEEIVYDIEQFNRLFKPNNYIKKENAEGAFRGKSAIVNSRKIYDPYFVSVDESVELNQIKYHRFTMYPYLISGFVSLLLFLVIAFNVERITITSEGIFITAFLLMLILPTIQKTIPFTKPLKNVEKRKLAKKPNFSFSREFPRSYEDYYNDNFGLRNNLINWGGTYKTKYFRSSMHPDLVKFGKKNWLFYNRMEGKIYKSYTNTNLLSEDRLKKIVDKWEENKKKYESGGRKYFLTFWPNKHTIYPEYLPATMRAQIKDTISRIDQILQYLDKHNSTVQLLDSRALLLEAKKEKQIYHKFDTHWNNYGAFLGYQNFFYQNKDALGILPKTKNNFEINWDDFEKGGLIQMLGVTNHGFFVEKAPTFTLMKNKHQIEFLPTEGYPKRTKITRNKYCGNKLKVLVFRDSFFTKLIPFFSLHFYEVTYIWGHGESYVEKLQPDIIIEGYVERSTGHKIR